MSNHFCAPQIAVLAAATGGDEYPQA